MADFVERFALRGPAEPVLGGGGAKGRAQIYLYIGVLAGTLSKLAFDSITAGGRFDAPAIIVAVIVSIVVFPQLYYAGGLDKRKLSLAHWAFAFQNGFFWSVAFAALSARASAG